MYTYQRGEPNRPRGHALIFYRTADATVLASYLVVPPISLDLAKYLPPVFAAKLSYADMETVSAIPVPPVPEEVPSVAYLETLSDARADDLLDGGVVDAGDLEGLLTRNSEAAQEYQRQWSAVAKSLETPALASESSLDLNAVLYDLMGPADRLRELAKLAGKLRYGVDVKDTTTVEEAVREMRMLAGYLPERFEVERIIVVARRPERSGSALSQLLVQRCYLLHDEDYRGLEALEREIRSRHAELEGGLPPEVGDAPRTPA